MTYTARPPHRGGPPRGGALTLSGVGFRAFTRPGWVALQVGFSHYVVVRTAQAARAGRAGVVVPGGASLAARLRQVRPPDPYKGRGLYPTGPLPLKPGKRR